MNTRTPTIEPSALAMGIATAALLKQCASHPKNIACGDIVKTLLQLLLPFVYQEQTIPHQIAEKAHSLITAHVASGHS